ncbi:MAG TPA: ABC transporter permease [Candidatus Acidoferrales bacterium]|nr:ABC transporter permease [Candidatus Acidoferrales bacterium]
MKLYRILALIERDMWKFFRSPALMVSAMVFPLMQLLVLGYAFGGKIRGVKVALVDEDRSSASRVLRERFAGIAAGPKTFRTVEYDSLAKAITDLRAGFVRAVVHIPIDFSRRVYQHNQPRIALVEDNTDRFMQGELFERLQQIVADLNAPDVAPRRPGQIDLQVVEIYPYIEYIKYLLAGSISMAIFVVAMIGGGITFIDDKARGLHEGYLVTPLHKAELILALNFSGALKGLMAGMTITIIGGLIAGIERIWEPMRLLYLLIVVGAASLAMISFMFLLMVRVSDPLVPRAIFGVLNTLLFFPSGAIYPTEGFPFWLKWISVVDPFTYVVHALKSLLLKNTGLDGIYLDILILLGFSVVLVGSCIALFKRQI